MRRITGFRKVHISMEPLFLNKVDTWCKMVGKSRSEFIRTAIRYYISSLSVNLENKNSN